MPLRIRGLVKYEITFLSNIYGNACVKLQLIKRNYCEIGMIALTHFKRKRFIRFNSQLHYITIVQYL